MKDSFDLLSPSIEYFVERKCHPSWSIEKSVLDFHDLTYVYQGSSTYIVNGHPYTLRPGCLLYAPKGATRQAQTDVNDPMHCFAFNFQYTLGAEPCVNLPLPPVSNVGIDNELLGYYRKFSELWLEKGPGYPLKAKGLFLVILHKLIYESSAGQDWSTPDSRIQKVKKYILGHYSEKIQVDTLAAMVDLNPVYFGSFFKSQTGCTVKEYINIIRVHKARDLLSMEGHSVGETALLCGFEDIYYFSKVFKKVEGVAPSTFLR